jgi:hypothetical protein
MRLEKLANDLLADRIEGSVINLYEVRALLNLVMACRLTLEMTGYLHQSSYGIFCSRPSLYRRPVFLGC